MIGYITIRHFKSLQDVDVDLSRINVFIGPNGSGKSSVAHALLVVKQSIGEDRRIKLNGEYISLGDFKDVVHSKARKPSIFIGLGGMLEGTRFRYNITFDEEGLLFHEADIVNDHAIKGEWKRNVPYEQKPTPAQIPYRDDPSIFVNLSCDSRIAEPIRCSGGSYGHAEDVGLKYYNLQRSVDTSLSMIRNMLKRVFVVPGIRGIDEFRVELQEKAREDFATSEGASKQASNLASTAGYNPEILDQISEWLRALGEEGSRMRHRLIQKTDPAQKSGITLEIVRPSLTANIINEGLGLNQLVFPLAVLAKSPPESLIAVEEPEIHLHPKLQSKLVDLLVSISKSQNKQLLLITHSEHILFRLLTKIAQRELPKHDVSVYYFSKEDLVTKTTKLQVTDEGRIEGGLPGFFEEEVKQFKEYLDALTGSH